MHARINKNEVIHSQQQRRSVGQATSQAASPFPSPRARARQTSRSSGTFPENSVALVDEVPRRVDLRDLRCTNQLGQITFPCNNAHKHKNNNSYLSLVQNDQPVVVDDRAQPMSHYPPKKKASACVHYPPTTHHPPSSAGEQEENAHLPVSNSDPLNSSRIAVWIFASVAKSMLLVASSSTMIALRRSSARAIAMSCRWPCEKFVPPADTLVSRLTVVFASMSVVDVPAVDAASVVSARSTFVIDGAREVARDELALARWRCVGCPVIMCTRRRTSRHSASSCSSEGER